MRMAYLDTCCLIYLLEDVPPFSARIRKLLASNMDVTLCLSPLVRMEVLVKPMMDANHRMRCILHVHSTTHARSSGRMMTDLSRQQLPVRSFARSHHNPGHGH